MQAPELQPLANDGHDQSGHGTPIRLTLKKWKRVIAAPLLGRPLARWLASARSGPLRAGTTGRALELGVARAERGHAY
jgi:hypothetical protein